MPKKERILDKIMNEVIWYGGLPMRYGDVMRDLEETAKSTGEKNWLRIRDAGLVGVSQFNERYPMPEGTEPVTYAEFERLTGEKEELPAPSVVPTIAELKAPTKVKRSVTKRVRDKKASGKKRPDISLRAIRY